MFLWIREEVQKVLNIINACTRDFKSIPQIDQTLSVRYEQQLNDIQEWLSITEWNDGTPMKEELISSVQNKMIALNVIDSKEDSDKLIRNMYI